MDAFFKKYSTWAIVAGGALWGLIGIFVNALTNAGIEAFDAMIIRCVFSAIILIIYMLITSPQKLKIRLKDIWMFLGTGVVSFFVYGSSYFAAIEQTSMAVAAMLLYTSPVFVMVMSAIFFKEKITLRSFASIVTAVVGCALVCGGARISGYPLSGLLLGLLSGFTYALYSIFGSVAAKRYPPETVTVYTFLFAGAGALLSGNPAEVAGAIASDSGLLWIGIGYAVFSAVLPYILYTGGLKYSTPARAAVTVCVEPVVAAVLGAVVYRESMSVGTVIGSVLILLSILVKNLEKKERNI